jgi:hypothetical protein
VLRNSSVCIVILVADAEVEMLVSAFVPDSQTVAPSLRVDRVDLGDKSLGLNVSPKLDHSAQQAVSSPSFDIAASGISLIGHVELSGDMLASPGMVLGEASSNLRLEGFQIVWPNMPDGVDIAYRVGVEGMGQFPTVTTGSFCGTRGEARRINEINISLTGKNAKKFNLEGVAFFSGGFKVPLAGGINISGPSGLEHLVALQLAVRGAVNKKTTQVNPWSEQTKTTVLNKKSKSEK